MMSSKEILLAAIILAFAGGDAVAYSPYQDKPSVEVHLDVLEQFRGTAPQQQFAPPPTPQSSYKPQPYTPQSGNFPKIPPAPPSQQMNSSAFVAPLPPVLDTPQQNYSSQQGYSSPRPATESAFVPPPSPMQDSAAAPTRYAPDTHPNGVLGVLGFGQTEQQPATQSPATTPQPYSTYSPSSAPAPISSAPVQQYSYQAPVQQPPAPQYQQAEPQTSTRSSAFEPLPDSRYANGRPLPPTPKSALAPVERPLPAFRAPNPPRDEIEPAPKKEPATKETAKTKEKTEDQKPAKNASIDQKFENIFDSKPDSVKPLPLINKPSAAAPAAPASDAATEIFNSVPAIPPAGNNAAKPTSPAIEPPSLDSILGKDSGKDKGAVPPLPDVPSGTSSKNNVAPPALPALPKEIANATPAEAIPAIPAISSSGKSIGFKAGDATLSDEAKKELSGMVGKMKSGSGNITIVSYASGADDKTSESRRISLSRAQAVRDFLKDAGVDPNRIVPQARGNQGGGNLDRVDIQF